MTRRQFFFLNDSVVFTLDVKLRFKWTI